MLGRLTRSSAMVATAIITAACALAPTAVAQLDPECGRLDNAYGPYDYTNGMHRREYLRIVELRHFTPKVEGLIAGESGGLIHDIDYTLRAFPNHHRALYAMVRFQLKDPVRPGSRYYTARCYLERATTFKPDDPIPRLLYGIYLQGKDDLEGARDQYEMALRIDPQSAEVNYNAGLLYLKLGEHEKALQAAHTAYANGHQLPGLRNQLKRRGLWQPPADSS
ncbi:MAG: tetratricopeptide repeat protein [Pseudomonadota bacterium]